MKECLVLSVKKISKSGRTSYELSAGAYQQAGTDFINYTSATYSCLQIQIDNDNFSIKVDLDGKLVELSKFDMIYLYLVGGNLEMASIISLYAKHHNIVCLPGDTEYVRPNGKLLQAALFFVNHVPLIPTYFQEAYSSDLNELPYGIPFVFKLDRGKKGRNNYRVESSKQWLKLINQDESFIVQEYIRNDGDYRVLCFGYEAKVVIKRSAAPDNYLNNTSQGATAKLIPVDKVLAEALRVAESAAKASKNEVAGVDIVRGKGNDRWYVIELNQSPQMSTGAFVEQKLDAFTKFLELRINDTDILKPS